VSGFANAVVGGMSKLIRFAIQSPNFVTGTSGWIIRKDGSAEFNNLVIRNGQIISGVQLIYNGTPAFGNLVSSITNAAGTDTFGNAYLAGNTQYFDPGTGNVFAMQNSGIALNWYQALTEAGPWNLKTTLNLILDLVNPRTLSVGDFQMEIGDIIVATDPSSVVHKEEDWHDITPLLINGWAPVSGGCRYKLNAMGRVVFDGSLSVGLATAANIASFPSGPYRPTVQRNWAAAATGGVVAGQSPSLQMSSGGTLAVLGVTPGTAGAVLIMGDGYSIK
jgi:hypothetical protein